MQDLIPLAERIADALKARRETIGVAESSSGGLISSALLAIPGASAYYLGGAVVYTLQSRRALLDLPDSAFAGLRGLTEELALVLALPRWVRQARPAAATAIRRVPVASPWPVPPNAHSRYTPATRTVSQICGSSPPKRSNCCRNASPPARPAEME